MPEFNVIKCVSCLVFQVGVHCAADANDSRAVPTVPLSMHWLSNSVPLNSGTASQENSEMGMPAMRSKADAPKGRQIYAGHGPKLPKAHSMACMVPVCMETGMSCNPLSPLNPKHCIPTGTVFMVLDLYCGDHTTWRWPFHVRRPIPPSLRCMPSAPKPNPPVPQVYTISTNAKDCLLVCTHAHPSLLSGVCHQHQCQGLPAGLHQPQHGPRRR